ncbi:MAG: hypothetical protein ACXWCS_24385 [Burkholderiales bacterium]
MIDVAAAVSASAVHQDERVVAESQHRLRVGTGSLLVNRTHPEHLLIA